MLPKLHLKKHLRKIRIRMTKARLALLTVLAVTTIVVAFIATQELHQLKFSTLAATNREAADAAKDAEKLRLEKERIEKQEAESAAQKQLFAEQSLARKEILAQNTKEVEAYLAKAGIKNLYGISFLDLNYTDLSYKHDAAKIFHPASIYKVPLAMLTLKAASEGKIDLETKITHEKKTKTLRTVLELMIQESNNDAMAIFENRLGGYDKVQNLIKTEFGASVVRRGQKVTADDFVRIFQRLYPNSEKRYLSVEDNSYLLTLMQTPLDWLQDRIPAAVKAFMKESKVTGIRVADKIGTLDGVYQDGAIIFGNNSDYVLIILNKSRLTTDATKEIATITKLLLKGLE